MKRRRRLDDRSRFNYARRDRPNLIECGLHQPALLCQVSDGTIPSSIVIASNSVIALLQICIHTSAMQGSGVFAHVKSWSTGKLRRCKLIPLLCSLSGLIF